MCRKNASLASFTTTRFSPVLLIASLSLSMAEFPVPEPPADQTQNQPTAPTGDVQHPPTMGQDTGNVIPHRIPKTHLPNLLDKLKSLPLKLKLSMNKNIEQTNFSRTERAYKHALDPVANPDPGSEAASMITISSEEMSSLSIPSFMSALTSVMPLYLLQIFALQDKDKRKREDSSGLTDLLSTMDARIAKRHCMDGSKLVPRSASAAVKIAFPQILFDTELEVSVPLSFFTHSNLRYIIDHASTLPTRRANGKIEGKGPIIIDVEKLAEKIGRELSIDFGQYTQASQQMYRFQSL